VASSRSACTYRRTCGPRTGSLPMTLRCVRPGS
jgi:hypothetical protein